MSDIENRNIKEILDKAQDEGIIYTLTCGRFLSNNQDLLLNHPTSLMSPKVFFSKALNCRYESNEIESEFIKSALDYGIDIADVKSYLSLKFLSEHQDILLNHSTHPMSHKVFFGKVFSYSPFKESDKKIQSGLVKLALDYGVDISDVKSYLSLEFLSEHQDILLNHSTHPMSHKVFFEKVFSSSPFTESDKKIQSGFVKLALDYGVDIADVKSYLSLEFLSEHQDILLNHSTHPMSHRVFFEKVFSYSPFKESDKKIQSGLVKLALDYGVDIADVKSYLSLEFLSEHQDVLLNHSTHPMSHRVFFEKVFSSSPFTESDKKIQSGFVKLALDYGMDIE